MKIQKINEKSVFLPSIVALGDENSQYLGFFAEKAFERAAALGNIIIATDGEEFQGYLLFYVAKSRAVIQHLCVATAHRNKGIGRQLVAELQSITAHCSGILLHCDRRFPAHNQWIKFGFVPIGEKRGRGQAENILTRFWLDYGHPDLLTDAIERSLGNHVHVVLDLNVLYDLNDIGPRPPESKALLADWIRESITCFITDEVFTEIDDVQDAPDRKRRKDIAWRYQKAVATPTSIEIEFEKLKRILPDDPADRRHIAITAAAEIEYFITRDDLLITRAQAIKTCCGVTPMHPTTFVVHFAELQRDFDYEPVRLSGSNIQLQRVGARQLPATIANFLDSPKGEKKIDFNNRLRNVLTRPDTNEVWIAQHDGKMCALIALLQQDEYRWSIPLFRVARSNLAGVIARNLLLFIVKKTVRTPASILCVEDPFCSPVVADTLPEIGFQESGLKWTRLTLDGIQNPQIADSHITKLKTSIPALKNYFEDIQSKLAHGLRSDASLVEIARVDRIVWPGKVDGGRIPCFIVPIQPKWALHLFDSGLANQDMFGAKSLTLDWEQAYYRGCRPHVLQAPARILWYVSKDDTFDGTSAIRACSRLDEVYVGSAKDVFKRFRRLGIFEWSHIKAIADRNPGGEIMGFRFGMTELFRLPVSRSTFFPILKETLGSEPPLSTAVAVPPKAFQRIYQIGNQDESNGI